MFYKKCKNKSKITHKSSTMEFSMDGLRLTKKIFPPFFSGIILGHPYHIKQPRYNYRDTIYIFSHHKQAPNYSISIHLPFTKNCYKVCINYSNRTYFKSCKYICSKWVYCLLMSVGQKGSGSPGSICTYTKYRNQQCRLKVHEKNIMKIKS